MVTMSEESRVWSKGNYGRMSEELLEFDWELAFEGLDGQQSNSLFLAKAMEVLNKYVPTRERCKRRLWTVPRPRSLLRAKSAAWARYKCVRLVHGRNHSLSCDAFSEFTRVNLLYKNYTLRRQAELEMDLIARLSDTPKAFHSYVRDKKKVLRLLGL